MMLRVAGGPEGWLLNLIGAELEALKEYAKLMETSLEQEFDKFSTKVDALKSRLPPDLIKDFGDFYNTERWQLTKVFPNCLRSSLFVFCDTFIFNSLVNFYNLLISSNPVSPKKRDFYEILTDIESAAHFTIHNNISWLTLCDYHKIRNLVVHNNGKIDPKDAEMVKKIKSISTITIDKSELIFSKEFCFGAIDNINAFLYELSRTFAPKDV